MSRRGGANFARQVLPLLLEATEAKLEYTPTLIFTSATAAMKGSAQCATFAMGKFAMRALAQSLAREFGPKGVHVVHAIIDGVIDIERTKDYKFDHPEAKISPQAVSIGLVPMVLSVLMALRLLIRIGTCIPSHALALRMRLTFVLL